MRLTVALLLAGFLQVSARGYSQEKITINTTAAPLKTVLRDIQRQTGYEFLYDDQVGDSVNRVTLNVHDANLREVLDQCFKDQPFTYEIVEDAVVIKRKQVEQDQDKPQEVVTATGTVLNEQGQALSGASVTDKRTGRTTITDARGEYKFPGLQLNSTLIISYVGFEAQSIKIKDATHAMIYLKIAKNELDKIVVQAYGNTTHRLATGDISTVSSAEIEKQPVANVLTAIEGKVPGLVVTQSSGYASAPFKVEIRGRSQIDPNRPSEPLYIIDGVPLTVLESGLGGNYASGSTGFLQNGISGPAGGQSPLFSINPNDIESISVLKDADATAIYGSRGANGVILITTKSGGGGKATFDLNAYQGYSEVTRHYSMLNTQQYLMVRHEAFKNDNITPNDGNAYDLLVYDTTRNTDWQHQLWGGTGKTTDIQAAINGGDKQNSFRISGAYHRQTDILTLSGANQRGSLQSNISHKSLNQKLSVSFINNFSYSTINIIEVPSASTLPPDAPAVYATNNTLNWSGWSPLSNPFGSVLQPYKASTDFLNSSLAIQYTLIKGLVFSTRLGYSMTHVQQQFLNPIKAQNPAYNPTGSATFGSNNNTNGIVEPQLEYKFVFGKGQIDALAGGSYQNVSQTGNRILGSGYLNDNLLRSITNAPSQYTSDNSDQYKYEAGFLRINYNLQSKYLLNLSARRDGSSRFGRGRQFGNFGSVGAAWVFSDEKWMKGLASFLSFGKLRGSYGITGSDGIGDYGYLSTWQAIQPQYIQGISTYQPQGLANPELEWQVNKKLEGALDLGFIQDRITAEIAWYRDMCGNSLVSEPLPTQTGFSSVTANLPALIRNEGVESNIAIKIIDKKNLQWNLKFDIGINRNKLVSFPNLSQSPYNGTFTVGAPLTIVKLLHYTGVDPMTGQYTFQDKFHNNTIDIVPTDSLNDLYNKDLTVRGEGGIGTDLAFKGFQLSAFFRFRSQQSPSNIRFMGSPGQIQNVSTEVLNRWQKPGDRAEFAAYTTSPGILYNYFQNFSDGVYCNGSYIRLQNVSLSYDLPHSLCTKGSIKMCRIYVHMENLFLITRYHGLDPDTPVFGALPPSKTIVAGIQLNL